MTPARIAERTTFARICARVDADDLLFVAHGEMVPHEVWEAPALDLALRRRLHELNAAQDAARLTALAMGQEAA